MGDNREVGRKSFILHIDSLAILDELTNEQKGILFDAIYKYQKGENVELDFAMRIAFLPFKNQFERDFESYLSRCNSNKINGLKGGRPKKQTKPKETKKTQSVILKPKKADSDNDNESEKDSNKDNFNITKSFKLWTKQDFLNSISELKESYTKDMLNEFYIYWTEKSASGKMKFQLQKTWETNLRLITWNKNQEKFNKSTQQDNPNRGGSPNKKAL